LGAIADAAGGALDAIAVSGGLVIVAVGAGSVGAGRGESSEVRAGADVARLFTPSATRIAAVTPEIASHGQNARERLRACQIGTSGNACPSLVWLSASSLGGAASGEDGGLSFAMDALAERADTGAISLAPSGDMRAGVTFAVTAP
jgi:hypothetical protein